MATIDIGKIKPVFKGAYNNSTAYVLDDIVYYNGSSYVAKQSTTGNVPTNGTYWEVLASGSGGIWDSSLSIGSAGQFLKVNSGATALEFGAVPQAGVLQTSRYGTGAGWQQATSGTSFTQINNGATDFDVTITPSGATNSIMIWGQLNVEVHPSSSQYGAGVRIKRTISGSSDYIDRGNANGSRPRVSFKYE